MILYAAVESSCRYAYGFTDYTPLTCQLSVSHVTALRSDMHSDSSFKRDTGHSLRVYSRDSALTQSTALAGSGSAAPAPLPSTQGRGPPTSDSGSSSAGRCPCLRFLSVSQINWCPRSGGAAPRIVHVAAREVRTGEPDRPDLDELAQKGRGTDRSTSRFT